MSTRGQNTSSVMTLIRSSRTRWVIQGVTHQVEDLAGWTIDSSCFACLLNHHTGVPNSIVVFYLFSLFPSLS